MISSSAHVSERAGGPVADLVAQQLASATSSWSIGGFGAIAEFHHAADAPARFDATSAVSRLGGIRLRAVPEVRAIAYEIPAQRDDYWHHGIVLCLPEAMARIATPGRIVALGPDGESLSPDEMGLPLYDLGVGAATFRFCVRPASRELQRALDGAVGKAFLDVAGTLAPMLLAQSPTRVALCAIGRVEVYQAIALPGGRTPDGPHTHLIPGLLRSTHTHSRNVPVPNGLLPAATLYPAHPLVDALGERKPFRADEHAAFQSLLARFGVDELVTAKQAVMHAALSGAAPEAAGVPSARHARLAARVGLRQLLHTSPVAATLATWRDVMDRPARP